MLELYIKKHLGRGNHTFNLDINIQLPPFSPGQGKILALFGPSGSGKTLTLNALSGLMQPDSGRIRLGDTLFFDSALGIDMPVRQRKIGYMFQEYALFPHLTVSQNIGFALSGPFWRTRLYPSHKKKVQELLTFFGIAALADSLPDQISGGQRQRVALARALAAKPQILLLDEPFASLDPLLRRKLRLELKDLLKSIALPCLLISHDPQDVEALADALALYKSGQARLTPWKNGESLEEYIEY